MAIAAFPYKLEKFCYNISIMAKILITGAGGYIGSIASYLFLERGHTIVAVDNFSTGYRDPLELLKDKFGESSIRIYESDLKTDLTSIFSKETDIHAVVHYAANCSVDESMQNPQKYFLNNTMGSLNLFSAMIEHNVLNLVFSSTCAVYGEVHHMPISEDHPTSPTNPYGESKRMTEQMISWYGKLKNMKYVILRYFNVCGATDDGLLGDSKKPSIHLMQNAVRGALGIEPFNLTCPDVDTPDKTPIRDYVHVVDLNNAHLLALEYLLKGGESKILNIGTGNGNSVLEIVDMVEKKTGKKLPVEYGQKRLGEYAKMIAEIKKAEDVLGWKPAHTLEQSIDSLISWYTRRPNGWEK